MCVAAFHGFLASGDADRAAELFSFSAAHEYWRTVTAAFGLGCPDEQSFASLLRGILHEPSVREAASSVRLSGFKCRVIGSVGSVVFIEEAPGGNVRTAVATIVEDKGRWKVRTYPGVFPGRLLAQAKRRASEQAAARNGGIEQ